jgi:hAT family C-terminal dimerisation region
MKPYCGALDKLQSDKARLSDVALSFGYFIRFWEQNADRALADNIIIRFEKRWDNWEQPLLLLSLVLHPKYRLDKFNPDLESVNFVTMGHWLSYYYKAWSSSKPTKLLAEFESYRAKKQPFNDEIYEQFDDDILAYWYYCSTCCKELGFIATKIFSICVNSASVERLFSTMGFLHSPRRNKLKVILYLFFYYKYVILIVN